MNTNGSATNDHGLARDIPEPVKRAVRQECAFACVLCGRLPYQFEHFDPPFVDAHEHNPDGMALLCPICHADKTAGRLSVERVRSARASPAAKFGLARWASRLGPDPITLVVGNNTSVGKRAGFQINDTSLLVVESDPETGEWWLTGSFVDGSGKQTLRFERNEIVAYTGVWDIKFEGTTLCVNNGPGDVAARITVDANASLVTLDRLQMPLANGHSIDVSAKALRLLHDGHEVLSIGGNTTSGSGGVGVQFGQATDSQNPATYQINLPAAGNLGDWLSLRVSGSLGV